MSWQRLALEAQMTTPKIGIIISSIREGRFGDKPAHWIQGRAASRTDLDVEIVDLRAYPLPLYGDANAASSDVKSRWQRKLAELDGYIFITAEYNHSVTGALKNALDYVNVELHRKPAAFVGYGGVGGARAVEQLRLICVEFQMAPLQAAVHIAGEPYRSAKSGSQLSDFDLLNTSADKMLDNLAWWAHTLRAGRTQEREE
jgi:NAD(P)H-dependent FMN reductase